MRVLTSDSKRKYLIALTYIFPVFVVFLIGALLYTKMCDEMTEQVEVKVAYTTDNVTTIVATTEPYVVNGNTYITTVTYSKFNAESTPNSVVINYSMGSSLNSCVKKEYNDQMGAIIDTVTQRVTVNM